MESSRSLLWRRFSRSFLSILGLFIVASMIITAVFAPFLSPYDPIEINLGSQLRPPSRKHFAGTDYLGRDIFSRIIHGTRIALAIGILVVVVEILVGVPLGLVAGYYGGRIDKLISSITDVAWSFPIIPLALLIVALIGPGLYQVIFAVAVVSWCPFTRVVRSETFSVKEKIFVESAKAIGETDFNVLVRYILPNVFPSIIVLATLVMPGALISASAMSFLGLGVQPPTPEWGSIISCGRTYLLEAPWITTIPGIFLVVSVLGFNFLGDGLREALDPRLQM